MRRALPLVLAAFVAVSACSDDPSSGNAGGGGGGLAASGGAAGFAGTAGSVGGSIASGGAAGGTAGGAGGNAAGAGGSAGLDAAAGSGGTTASDAGDGATDAAVPLAGFGIITGDCGPIDATEILSPSPFSFETVLDFGTSPFDETALSPGGKKVWSDGNLGGNSLYSEVFSYEVLYRCELAKLLKTETEIVYNDALGKKTDLLVEIDGYKLGVSVTRAFAYPPGSTYSVAQAQSLLEKKLGDVLASSQNVSAADGWKKQILHVLAYDNQHRDALTQAYPLIPVSTRADTVVMVTVTDGDDAFVY